MSITYRNHDGIVISVLAYWVNGLGSFPSSETVICHDQCGSVICKQPMCSIICCNQCYLIVFGVASLFVETIGCFGIAHLLECSRFGLKTTHEEKSS